MINGRKDNYIQKLPHRTLEAVRREIFGSPKNVPITKHFDEFGNKFYEGMAIPKFPSKRVRSEFVRQTKLRLRPGSGNRFQIVVFKDAEGNWRRKKIVHVK